MVRVAALSPLLLLLLGGAEAPAATVEVEVAGLRNARGSLHVCLTRSPKHFPNCKSDAAAIHQTIAATAHHVRFTGLTPGRYAVTLFHDENSNRRLDKMLGIPREGFGFSRNPVIRFGAPQFDKVGIELAPGFTRTRVRMQYLL